MKHYYDDEGNMDCLDFPDRLLDELASSIDFKQESFTLERARIIEKANELIYDYECRAALGTLGGGMLLHQWKETFSSDPYMMALKKMFILFVDMGYVPQEFMIAAYRTLCTLQMNCVLANHVIGEDDE